MFSCSVEAGRKELTEANILAEREISLTIVAMESPVGIRFIQRSQLVRCLYVCERNLISAARLRGSLLKLGCWSKPNSSYPRPMEMFLKFGTFCSWIPPPSFRLRGRSKKNKNAGGIQGLWSPRGRAGRNEGPCAEKPR